MSNADPAPEDPVPMVADALADSPVYVDESLSAQLPDDVVSSLVTTIDDNDLPIYVVAYPLDYQDVYGGRASQFLAVLHEEVGTDASFVHTDADGRLETYAPGTQEDYWVTASVAEDEPSMAEDLERFLELVVSGEGPALFEAREAEDMAARDDGPSVWLFAGIIAVVVIGLFALYRSVIAPRRNAVPLAVRRAYDVPQSVIDAVRTSHESAVAEQARERVLALGQALDRTAVPTESDAVTEYQAALDAYDAATRTVDANAEPHLADAVGAYVLTETGQAHLGRATGSARDRKRAMPRPCYFNPLHGTGTRHVALPGNTGSKVPACDDCAQATKAGVAPQALIVTVDGASMPYYEAGLEPWASSGYGALGSDLANRVLTRGIDR